MKNRLLFGVLVLVLVVCIVGFTGLALVSLCFSSQRISFKRAPVAVIKIEGAIFESEDTLKELDKYREDKFIKAVVLRINSPGGAVAPSQEIFSQVLKLRQSGKKVIVSMGTLAASGGYYIAAAADKIVASPGTITGSIGVIMESFGLQDLVQTLRVESRVIKSGKLKDVGSPFRTMSEEDRAFLQGLTDNLYNQFIRDVSEQRKIPLEEVKLLAEGKVYSGEQARELKLIDEIGNLYDAIALARKMAGLPDDAEVEWPHEPGAWEEFISRGGASQSLQNLFLKLGNQVVPLWMYAGARTPLIEM